MARIENNTWVIETKEEAEFISNLINNPRKINSKLKEALKAYQKLQHENLKDFLLFPESIVEFNQEKIAKDLKSDKSLINSTRDTVTVNDILSSFDNNRLNRSIDKLINMPKDEYIKLYEKYSELPSDANIRPWKYATHCLKADEYGSIFICKENQQQLLYIDGTWQPSDVYKGILKEIETEYHPNIDNECNLISRKDIQYYQNILDTKGYEELKKKDTQLCNSNSMGAIPHIVAIRVVLFNNDYLHITKPNLGILK